MTFLEQLQESAGLLSNDVASVGNYMPQASDFVSGVPQNRFVGNQFQMPELNMNYSGASTYTPGAFQANYTPMATQPAPSITSPGGSGREPGYYPFQDFFGDAGFKTAEDLGYSLLGDGTDQNPYTAQFQNPKYVGLLDDLVESGKVSDDYKGYNFGDKFTPGPGIGKAYDDYGRLRDIGILNDLGLNMYNAFAPTATAITDNITPTSLLSLVTGIPFVGPIIDAFTPDKKGDGTKDPGPSTGPFTAADDFREQYNKPTNPTPPTPVTPTKKPKQQGPKGGFGGPSGHGSGKQNGKHGAAGGQGGKNTGTSRF